jgi:hypothetical protein
MTALGDYAATIAAVAASIAAATGLYSLYFRKKEQTVQFKLDTVQESIKSPIDSNLGIRIMLNNKPIEKCKVFYNGKELPWGIVRGKIQTEQYVITNGGAHFLIPVNAEDGEAIVVIKNGNKTLKPTPIKLKDIHMG